MVISYIIIYTYFVALLIVCIDLPRHCITSGLFPLNIYQRYLPHSAPNLLPRTVLYTPLHRKATTGSSTDSMIETSRGESSSVLKQ